LTHYGGRSIVNIKKGTIVTDVKEFQNIIGVNFQNMSLLEQALVHSSYINENPEYTLGHNEKLEFLGDAVLGFYVAEKLYKDYPDTNEGQMTKFRAALVSRDALARVTKSIRLGDFLYLGRGEESSGGRHKKANLAGALEAVIAAVYLDRGENETRDFILRILDKEMKRIDRKDIIIDYKSRLQETIQSKYQTAPGYRLVSEKGPDHDKTFTVEVIVNETVLGRGTGKSKKEAETEAARFALENL
jgi:ribonuclease-3